MQLVSIAYAKTNKTKTKNYYTKTKPLKFIYMFVTILLILYLKFLNSILALISTNASTKIMIPILKETTYERPFVKLKLQIKAKNTDKQNF